MDEDTKKCTCTDECTCKCNSVDCGCCEKKSTEDAGVDTEAEPIETVSDESPVNTDTDSVV